MKLTTPRGGRSRDADRVRLSPIGAALLATFALATSGLLGLTVIAWELLHRPRVAQGNAISLHDAVSVIQLVFASVAGAGALVALIVAYRRQKVAEADSHHDLSRVFNERFAMIASQLGDSNAAVRLAAVYAMAGLADDWVANRQTCIDVLCAYLRMPYERKGCGEDPEDRAFRASQEVRHTVAKVIASRLRPSATVSWQGYSFDFTGAVFDGGDFSGAVFAGGSVTFKNAVFVEGLVDFRYALFQGGHVSFASAQFTGATVSFDASVFKAGGRLDFTRAKFIAGSVDFGSTVFYDGDLSFSRSQFSGTVVSYQNCNFTGGHIAFNGCKVSGGRLLFGRSLFLGTRLEFIGMVFGGGATKFDNARFAAGQLSFSQTTFQGGQLCFDNSMFGAGLAIDSELVRVSSINFAEFMATLVRRRRHSFADQHALREPDLDTLVDFGGAAFIGSDVRFFGATFGGGKVDFRGVSVWSMPPIGIEIDPIPAGVLYPEADPSSPVGSL